MGTNSKASKMLLLFYLEILITLFFAVNNINIQQVQAEDWSMIMEVEVEDPNTEQITPTKVTKFGLGATPCGDVLCLNKAKCLMPEGEHGSFKCLCQIGFGGTHCEKVNNGFRFPRIEEGGYLKFLFTSDEDRASLSKTKSKPFHVRFEMKPESTIGRQLIVYHRTKYYDDNFLLTLENGHLIFRSVKWHLLPLNTGDLHHIIELRHTQALIPDSLWYKVEFGRTPNEGFYLSLNKQIVKSNENRTSMQTGIRKTSIPYSQLHQDFIYIGGYPDLELLRAQDTVLCNFAEKTFVGCIQHIHINGKYVDPRKRPFVGDAVEGFGLSDCALGICDQNHCANNGTCAVISGSAFECWCPMGTKGFRCQTHEDLHLLQFVGRSYTEYIGLQGTSQSRTTLLLTFRPAAANGLLLYQGYSYDRRGDFLTVLLVQNHVEVQFDLGSGTATLKSPSILMLNTWHTVRFWLTGRQGFLVVDNEEQVTTAFSVGPLVQLTLDQHLFLGFHPDADLTSAYLNQYLRQLGAGSVPGFQGCIQELQLNGQNVDLLRDALRGVNVENCDSHPCARPDITCQHSAECVPSGEDFHCLCRLGYVGKNCDAQISLTQLKRVSFDSRSFVEYSSPAVTSKLNTPHFDIYFDIRLRSVNSRQVMDQNYLREPMMTDEQHRVLLSCLTVNDDHMLIGYDLKGFAFLSTGGRTARWSSQMYNSVSGAQWNQTKDIKREATNDPNKLMLMENVWHKVMLKRRGDTYFLFLNGTQIDVQSSDGLGHGTASYNRLVIGNMDTNRHQFEKDPKDRVYSWRNINAFTLGFNGCMENLHINGRPLLIDEATSGKNIDEC